MRYVSTRGGLAPVDFSESVLMGMATDGGLLVPESIPDVSQELGRWRKLSYRELAFEVMRLFADVPPVELRGMIDRAYASFTHAEITPLVQVGDRFILELFHGPTLAFKDVALQMLGNLFESVLRQRGAELNILAATSGDTGSAAIQGVRGRAGIRIFVMHPHGRVSRTQELQMTSVLDDNVHNLAVRGTFDDCQAIMKRIFTDVAFKQRLSLGSVNSINWARVLAQIVYFFYGGFRAMDATGSRRVAFSVPTGNFGDILAGWYAARMGLPVSRLILATNENDILARFFNTGEYKVGPVHATISPSMDIQVASNFERYLYHRAGNDGGAVSRMMAEFGQRGCLSVRTKGDGVVDPLFAGVAGATEATVATIREVYNAHGYLLDPHTAVGVYAAGRVEGVEGPTVCLATAHPAKFGETLQNALGKDVAHHPLLEALEGRPQRCDVVDASVECVQEYIRTRVAG